MPLELRRSFQLFTAITGTVAAFSCGYLLNAVIPPESVAAKLAIFVLVPAAVIGFDRMLTMFLPLFLPKIWPRLDS